MRHTFGLRGRRLALVAVGIFALAAGIAYAAIPDAGTGVYHACMLNTHGTIRIIDPATEQCRASNETEITFNQNGQKGDPGSPGTPGAQGPAGTNGTNGTDGTNGTNGTDGTNGSNGTNGVSPTVQQLPPGDPNCGGAGGVAITGATGPPAYVCSGANGQKGADGTPFSGTFTSPNGEYSLKVTDTGVVISALNGAKIDFSDSAINVTSRGATFVRSDGDFTVMGSTAVTLRAALNLSLRGDSNVNVQSSGPATVSAGGPLALTGSNVAINGGFTCFPAVRVSDAVTAIDAATGQAFVVALAPGASTVCIGN
jgi:hypothetical protein